MKKKLAVAGIGLLLFGCISHPEPWVPSGDAVDAKTDGQNRSADATGEITPEDLPGREIGVDVEKVDATPDVIDVVDIVQPDAKDVVPQPDTTDVTGEVVEDTKPVDVLDDTGEDVCQPQCEEKECGDDGCGGNCGECEEEQKCILGTCHPDYCAHGLQEFGCCFENTLFWCEEGDLKTTDCSANQEPDNSCGWKSEQYTCDGDGADPDPDETLPFECCEPDCTDKECGSDGCWVSCGDCEEWEECVGGICQCIPDCEDKECGADGCNGSCGDCNDELACTDDLCSEDGLCVFDVNELFCVVEDTCIQSQTENPGNVCQMCLPATDKIAWANKENGTSCGDNAACQEGICTCLAEECGEACCAPGVVCFDGDCCTPQCEDKECGVDSCGGSCGECTDDGDICNGGISCNSGLCKTTPGPDCNDNDECTYDLCEPETGCYHEDSTIDCEDGNPCTHDLCDKNTGCYYLNADNDCDDGDACTTQDECEEGMCISGPNINCGDGDACTVDSCDKDSGCLNEAIVPCCGNSLVEDGEQCDDPMDDIFCSIDCESQPATIWRSGQNSHTSNTRIAAWCGNSGRCGILEVNRWSEECNATGDWPEGVWLRWISSRGLPIGPGIQMPPDFREPYWLHWEENVGGLAIGQGANLDDGGKWLYLVPISADGTTTMQATELVNNIQYSSAGVGAVKHEGDYWVVWVERDADSNPYMFRLRGRRFDATGNGVYPAQNITGNLEETRIQGLLVTTHSELGVCAYWRQTDKTIEEHYLKRACLTEFASLDGDIQDVLGNDKMYYFTPHSLIPLQNDETLILGTGDVDLSDEFGPSIRALRVEADGSATETFLVNQVDQGKESSPVGVAREDGMLDIFWRVQENGSTSNYLNTVRMNPQGVMLSEQQIVSSVYLEGTSPIAVAASDNGESWLLWKAMEENGIYQSLWAKKLADKCYSSKPCHSSESDGNGGCLPLAPDVPDTQCTPDNSCASAGLCDGIGVCSPTAAWPNISDCAYEAGMMDDGSCNEGVCDPKPNPCSQESDCTVWQYDRLIGCIPIHKCCGNGQIEEFEPCDDGPLGSDWCSSDCKVLYVPLCQMEDDCLGNQNSVADSLVAHDGAWHVAWVDENPVSGDFNRVHLVRLDENAEDWEWQSKVVVVSSPKGTSISRAVIADLPKVWGQAEWEVDVLVRLPPPTNTSKVVWNGAFQSKNIPKLDNGDEMAGEVDCGAGETYAACISNFGYIPAKNSWNPSSFFAYSGHPDPAPSIFDTVWCGGNLRMNAGDGGKMLGTYWTCPKTIRANPIVPSGNGFVDSPDCHVSLDDVAHYASGWTGTDSFALLQMSCEKSCGVPCEFCIASTDLAGCDGSLVKSCGEFSYENVKLHSHLQTGSYSLIRLPNGETVLIAGLAGMMGLSPTQVVVAKMQESGFGPLRSLRASLKNEALSFVKWGDFIGIFHWVDDGTDSLFVSRIPLDHIMNVLGAD